MKNRKLLMYKKECILGLLLVVIVAGVLGMAEYDLVKSKINAPIVKEVDDHLEEEAKALEEDVLGVLPNVTRKIYYYESTKTFLNATGFATEGDGVQGRTEAIGTERYRKVFTELELLQALEDARDEKVDVIEICSDMYLGIKELGLTPSELKGYHLSAHEKPHRGWNNPVLERAGVSKLDISGIEGLTIFSKNGAKLLHCEWKLLKSAKDIVFRNLVFDELWQWDETGKHKDAGWTFVKINGASNVWFDHCTFTMAADGLVDIENEAQNVTLSWCKFGVTPEEADEYGGILDTLNALEERYQNNKLRGSRYTTLRNSGLTKEQIMSFTAYHSKCHLNSATDAKEVQLENTNLSLTLAYNYYRNIGQRVPLVHHGIGHMYNCVLDNSTHEEAMEVKKIFKVQGIYVLARAMNPRSGGVVGADTCVFKEIKQPMIGSEYHETDIVKPNDLQETLFANARNTVCIVNSKMTLQGQEYVGNSTDSNGNNPLAGGFEFKDKEMLRNFAWRNRISNAGEVAEDPSGDLLYTFEYDQSYEMPYQYQIMPLSQVEEIVSAYAGAGKLELSEEEWLQVTYE